MRPRRPDPMVWARSTILRTPNSHKHPMNRTRMIFVAVLLAAGRVATAADAPHEPTLPEIPNRLFHITDHGAVTGGAADNTKAIQETVDAAVAAGGGVVDIPAGEYLSGPFKL